MALSWIEIDRDRLLFNLSAFRALGRGQTALMTVVKANAYGHGLETVAPAVAEATDWFGVNSLEEALSLSRLGIAKPILIMGHTPPAEAETLVRSQFRQVVYRLDLARALAAAAQKAGAPALVHLKVETGTHRQGVSPAELAEFAQALAALPGLRIEGAYTHFANIEDTLDPSYARLQLERFQQALELLSRLAVQPTCLHAAATAGAILYPETHFTLIRVGIGAYGIWPSRETRLAARERGRAISLAPVLTWKSRIAQVKSIQAGDYVGYGLTFQANRPMRLAIVPVGYYDGYDRKLSNCGRALVGGKSAPVVGRVAMNMMVLDVTDTDGREDDEVVLMGRQGSSEITAEELAEKLGTIPYEILSRINPLLPRALV